MDCDNRSQSILIIYLVSFIGGNMTSEELRVLEQYYDSKRRLINLHLNNKNISKALEVINEAKVILDKINKEKRK